MCGHHYAHDVSSICYWFSNDRRRSTLISRLVKVVRKINNNEKISNVEKTTRAFKTKSPTAAASRPSVIQPAGGTRSFEASYFFCHEGTAWFQRTRTRTTCYVIWKACNLWPVQAHTITAGHCRRVSAYHCSTLGSDAHINLYNASKQRLFSLEYRWRST